MNTDANETKPFPFSSPIPSAIVHLTSSIPHLTSSISRSTPMALVHFVSPRLCDEKRLVRDDSPYLLISTFFEFFAVNKFRLRVSAPLWRIFRPLVIPI